ncbi:UNVERIFIED_CONTAM: hypothetical protein Sangu_2262900 [Sesamum angustifolium]|uniref:Uncharacterized protein n=1 Tax=Sesamum angustifolium TaxID=2727405 RepID=A0AAW2L7B9_9LAMI
MAAWNPAACALSLSSKLHPPLVINTNGDLVSFVPGTTLLVSGEHASKGSAKYSVPHSPDPLSDGAEITRSLYQRIACYQNKAYIISAINLQYLK